MRPAADAPRPLLRSSSPESCPPPDCRPFEDRRHQRDESTEGHRFPGRSHKGIRPIRKAPPKPGSAPPSDPGGHHHRSCTRCVPPPTACRDVYRVPGRRGPPGCPPGTTDLRLNAPTSSPESSMALHGGVHEHRGSAQRLPVAFAHVGTEAAHQVEVRTGLQPRSPDERVRRHGGAGDEVRLPDSGLEVRRDGNLDAGQDKGSRHALRPGRRPVPDRHPADAGADRAMGHGEVRRQRTRRPPPAGFHSLRGRGNGCRRRSPRRSCAVSARRRPEPPGALRCRRRTVRTRLEPRAVHCRCARCAETP